MPYILRDPNGVITCASTQSVPGAEIVPYDHPELTLFLQRNGQSPQTVYRILAELRTTDTDMARAIEDVVMALFKKNILKMSDLPKPVQDRMALRVKLRMEIQDIFTKASAPNK